jgi:Skp family chaperone for outer membrane proteins
MSCLSKGVLAVRIVLFSAAIVAGLSVVAALAQVHQPEGPVSAGAHASRYGTAVVDISYIFKHHHRFKAKMDAMKKDVEATENALRQQRQAIAKLQEKLEQLKAGTADYKALDDRIAEEKAEFNLKASKQRKEFLDREAKTYYQTYLEVSDAVKYYAQRHNIGLVVRFNGDPIDPNRREDVLRAINRPVIYQNGIDITPHILQDLNRTDMATGTRGKRRAHPIPGGRPQVR